MRAPERILVAIPYLPTLHPDLQERMHLLAGRLAAANDVALDVVICNGTVAVLPGAPPYSAHALARNQVLERHLSPEHTHVLWIDSDLVRYPADLPTRLLGIDRAGVVAPLVLIEDTQVFYDTAGFVEAGRRVSAYPPYFRRGEWLVDLDSVGCCYLIPASVYRAGARYSATPGHTEHWSVCQAARAQGHRVVCVRTIRIEHANLPRYGERWHQYTQE